MESPHNVATAIQMLGEGDAPSKEVDEDCEAFLCSLFYPRGTKLSRVVLRAHLQARIWAQDLVAKPNIPDLSPWTERKRHLHQTMSLNLSSVAVVPTIKLHL
ncbi:hypothetical protein Pcinc_020633 [Petrolisthes cinctipes]|nr:hypothetical protein Pcinc_035405 [Petrolisthes cinctipes]KAK3874428.1 hypothetical protein Pcinc_020633 [Petrolisthes cinctipes]